jgi:N-acetylglutamate synthase-like GNAT family acetyltransferase
MPVTCNSKFSFATDSDATAVRRLLLNCGLPDQDVHEHLEDFIVAKDNHELVGMIGLQVLGRIGLLRSLAVESRYRNQGLGKTRSCWVMPISGGSPGCTC